MKITLSNAEVRGAVEKYVRRDVLDYSYRNEKTFAVHPQFDSEEMTVLVEEINPTASEQA
jgi:hypothetical protein